MLADIRLPAEGKGVFVVLPACSFKHCYSFSWSYSEKTFSVEEQFRTIYEATNNNWIKLKLSDGNWNNNAYNNNNYVRCVR